MRTSQKMDADPNLISADPEEKMMQD